MGPVIDTMTVVRLKRGLLPEHDRKDWGSRTDYLCACSPRFDKGKHPFWLAKWEGGLPKPTTGFSAVMEANRRFPDSTIYVIGFDRLMHPERCDPPHAWLAHDKWAEHEALKALGVRELG